MNLPPDMYCRTGENVSASLHIALSPTITKKSGIFVDNPEKMRIIPSCMDTEKKSRIPECGNVPDLAGVKTVVGAKQLKKAVEAGRVRYVFLAENADPAVTAPIALLCRSKKVQTAWVPSMAELGRACGIEVGAAAAAVVD